MGENLPTPGKLVSSKLKSVFKTKMYELMADLGRQITLYFEPSIQDCPNCLWDHIKKRSKNIYDTNNSNALGPLHKVFLDGKICPVCAGQGKLMTPSTTPYTALMSTKFKDDEITVVGTSHEGLIKTTTHIGSFSDISAAKKMTVDDTTYEPVGLPQKTGLQDRIMVKMFWKQVK